jgi:hypothetical protein
VAGSQLLLKLSFTVIELELVPEKMDPCQEPEHWAAYMMLAFFVIWPQQYFVPLSKASAKLDQVLLLPFGSKLGATSKLHRFSYGCASDSFPCNCPPSKGRQGQRDRHTCADGLLWAFRMSDAKEAKRDSLKRAGDKGEQPETREQQPRLGTDGSPGLDTPCLGRYAAEQPRALRRFH